MDFELTPPDRVLGPPGRGARALGRALEHATVAAALECVGACFQAYRATISAGTSEIQRNIIAQRVLGLPQR